MMTEKDTAALILERFLCFLEPWEFDRLLDLCRLQGWDDVGERMLPLLSLEPEELVRRIHRSGDLAETVMAANALLWRRPQTVDLGFLADLDLGEDSWTVHRFVAAAGHPGVEEWSLPKYGGLVGTYSSLISDLAGFYLDGNRSNDTDDRFSLLADCLNVVGPLRVPIWLDEAPKLADYIVGSMEADVRAAQMLLSSFTILVSDVGLPRAVTLPCFERLAMGPCNQGPHAIPAWILGVRLYGERASHRYHDWGIPLVLDLQKE